MCAAAAFGGGLATLVLVNTSNSRPYDRGDHPHTEAAALQHRLAVVETQLAELTATVSMLTTMTTGTDTDTDTDTGSSSSNHRRLSTPLSDNDLVCTSFRAWVSSAIYDEQVGFVDSNLTVRSLRSFVVG